MLDHLLILAEGGSHASEGVSPFLVGGGFFVFFMILLGITYLFSGLNQKVVTKGDEVAHREGTHAAGGSAPHQH
ncbi:hypothetical protein BRM3_10845 [Brachybacterium huguangmaarense]|uniref:4-hydroxybenzoate polyprenyltransferase n=1 Tax=Brachybacterium huguangmaarense TaxID=1652028 RepID=A0ABY6FYU9_9MICO|nr:hypothetical protein [Brachybacterium huguangmaarense]UYG16116.1 hypothetical protein BRM3_10845 [Brachybacterium huguangmaarense]